MAARKDSPEPESEFSLTVARALQILLSFAEGRSELGISELARELSQHKVSVQRNMRALEKYDFVEKNPETRKYRIGLQVYRLGRLFAYSRLLENHAEPLMQELVAETGYSAYLAAMKQGRMIIISSLEGNGPLRFSIPVGTILPLAGTAVGKAALSSLDDQEVQASVPATGLHGADVTRFLREIAQARKIGYATVSSEHYPGVGAVASPIVDAAGKLIAVVSLGFAVGQVAPEKVATLGRKIKDAASEIARRQAQDETRWSASQPRKRTPAGKP
jgi:IclR family KDG regulon transcriptional repressor